MVLAALLLLASSQDVLGDDVLAEQRCSAEHGPEVGLGILCDRVRVALEARELSVADDLSRTVVELAPNSAGAWVLRAEVAQRGRRVAEARQYYEKAAEADPASAAVLIAMGDFEAEEGNVRGAAVLYEKAAEIDPEFPGLDIRLDAVAEEPQADEI